MLRGESTRVAAEPKRDNFSLQNEEVYPEKVEMVVDPAEETTRTVSLGGPWGVKRRHNARLGRKSAGRAGGRPAGGGRQWVRSHA